MVVFITLGYDPESGKVREVFGSSRLASRDLDYLIADACVVISLALQHGVEPGNLMHSLHTTPDIAGKERAASLIGLVVEIIIDATQATNSS